MLSLSVGALGDLHDLWNERGSCLVNIFESIVNSGSSFGHDNKVNVFLCIVKCPIICRGLLILILLSIMLLLRHRRLNLWILLSRILKVELRLYKVVKEQLVHLATSLLLDPIATEHCGEAREYVALDVLDVLDILLVIVDLRVLGMGSLQLLLNDQLTLLCLDQVHEGLLLGLQLGYLLLHKGLRIVLQLLLEASG